MESKEQPIQLENYFEFLETQDIRIKGTRIGIEVVIEDFLEGASPEEIAIRYPNLSLEQIYATITYYLANQQDIEAYMAAGRQEIEQAARAQDENPPEVIKRLRRLKQEKVSVDPICFAQSRSVTGVRGSQTPSELEIWIY